MSFIETIQCHFHLKSELDVLADQIKAAIAKTGCCILDDNDLAIVWDNQEASDDQKRLSLEQFAKHNQFSMHLTPRVKVAVFTSPEHPWHPVQK